MIILPSDFVNICDYAYNREKLSNVDWINETKAKLNKIDQISDFVFFESKKTDTQCISFVIRGHRFLVFRGTENIRDWMTNANAFISSFGTYNYHKGMGQSFASIEGKIRKFLSDKPSLPIISTGHSLGGALAQICSMEVPGVVSTVTIGAPPVTSSDNFKKSTDALHFMNIEDPVPRSMLIGSLLGKVLVPVLNYLSKEFTQNERLHGVCKVALNWVNGVNPHLIDYLHHGRLFIINKNTEMSEVDCLTVKTGDFLSGAFSNPKKLIQIHGTATYSKRLQSTVSWDFLE